MEEVKKRKFRRWRKKYIKRRKEKGECKEDTVVEIGEGGGVEEGGGVGGAEVGGG